MRRKRAFFGKYLRETKEIKKLKGAIKLLAAYSDSLAKRQILKELK